MKIVFILRAMANVAGTERVMSDKINWLAERGHDVSLVTYEQGSHPLSFVLHPSVRIIDINTRFFMLSNISLYHRIWETWKLRKRFLNNLQDVVDSIRPDVIIVTTYSMNVISEILKIRTKANLIMESHVAWFSVSKEYDYRSNLIMSKIAHFYDKYIFSRVAFFDLLLVLTEGDKKDWSMFVHNVKAIPNPLTYYPDQIPSKSISHRIICVGRLNEQKGFDLLIDAFSLIASQCPEWHVDIFGHGEEESNLLNQINRKGLKHRVNILKPTSDIYVEFMQSDFFVLSSRYEGFGLVLIEAMSCGIPCVAFNCNYGPNEIIEDGINGLLVNNGDVNCLAEKMLWIITHESNRLEMGKNAHVSVSRYCKDRVMQQWEQAYLSV